MELTRYASVLQAAGMRVTSARLATLAVVAEQQHIDADGVAQQLKARLGTVSTQAVYDGLRALTTAGLLRRITADSGAAKYELERHDNHHHLLCRRCGRLEDLPCATGHVPCLQPPDTGGARIEVAEVLYRGLCAKCATRAADETKS